MNKKSRSYLLIFLLGVLICFGQFIYLKKLPEFIIYQSYKVGADNYKSVNLKVIVNVSDYDANKMFEKVRNEYVKLNGVPDVLYIEFFDSQYAFENAESSGSIKYER